MPLPAAAAAMWKGGKAVRRVASKARRRADQDGASGTGWRIVLFAGLIAVLGFCMVFITLVISIAGTRDPHRRANITVGDIPAEALAAYQQAGQVWGVDWAILAGVGKKECDHGRAQLEGCNPPDTVNRAGARGYMQFLGNTWRTSLGRRELEPRTSPPALDGQGYATDGDADGDADPWSWPDATHSAARYLFALGVAQDAEAALLGYNHDQGYVDDVLSFATGYRAASVAGGNFTGSPGNVPLATVEGITVHAQIADQVAGLVQAARDAGFRLTGGGYRSPEDQIRLRRQHCGTTQYAIYVMPSSACTPPTARPGTSNHEMGLAIDFSCNGALIRSRSSACFTWLARNAASYGLANLPREPWHWSVDGT